MITFDEFSAIDKEVKDSVVQGFKYLKEKSMNYVLFLANGEYKPQFKNSNLNPYLLDSREEKYKDKDRMSFFINFMETFYAFVNKESTKDDNNLHHLELMVYTHIWESKPFLRQLLRFTQLCEGKSYPWSVTIPDMSKHFLIREEIRNSLLKRNLNIANVISKGFHTSLRNAFAHSEYHFIDSQKKIVLDTYSGKEWDIKDISYNDWSKRFAYSVLLSYHWQNTFYECRNSLIKDFDTDTFIIIHPINESRFRAIYIYYDVEPDIFNFAVNRR